MVELNQTFLNQAKSYLGDQKSKVDQYICSGLQDFVPEPGRYNVIWCQWVLGHLTDEDSEGFLCPMQSCHCAWWSHCGQAKMSLQRKETFDQTDSSYTRPKSELMSLIKQSGLKIIKVKKQEGFTARFVCCVHVCNEVDSVQMSDRQNV